MKTFAKCIRVRRNVTFTRIVLASAITLEASAVVAQLPDILAMDYGGRLTRWNVESASAVYSVNTGAGLFNDMYRSKDGGYFVYRTFSLLGGPALFEIDAKNGSVALKVESNNASPGLFALTEAPSGQLFAHGYVPIGPSPGFNVDRFISISPRTLAYHTIEIKQSIFSSNLLSIGGMATSPDGLVYAWASGDSLTGGVASKLITIDMNTQTAAVIGGFDGLDHSIGFLDLAFTPDGRLFGFTEVNGGLNGEPILPNSVYELDLQTGMPRLVTQVGAIFAGLRGAEFVPEPGSAFMVVVAWIALAAGSRATLLKARGELRTRTSIHSARIR